MVSTTRIFYVKNMFNILDRNIYVVNNILKGVLIIVVLVENPILIELKRNKPDFNTTLFK